MSNFRPIASQSIKYQDTSIKACPGEFRGDQTEDRRRKTDGMQNPQAQFTIKVLRVIKMLHKIPSMALIASMLKDFPLESSQKQVSRIRKRERRGQTEDGRQKTSSRYAASPEAAWFRIPKKHRIQNIEHRMSNPPLSTSCPSSGSQTCFFDNSGRRQWPFNFI